MGIRILKNFHEKVMERYRQEEEETMEAWKQKVMQIHEKSGLLFYFDEFREEDRKNHTIHVLGSLVKGAIPPKTVLWLYTGEGRCMGTGRLLTDPEEKEEGRDGLLKRRRNEFVLELHSFLGKDVSEMPLKEINRMLRDLQQDLSLIADISM